MSDGSSARRAAERPAADVEATAGMVRTRLLFAGCAAALVTVAGCTGFGGDPGQAPAPVPQPAGAPQAQTGQWVVDTREHVDLWLHAFALLQADSTRVPFFRRGYRDSVVAARKRANVISMIDVNRQNLSARFLAFPNLVSAQFVPLYFGTWEETRTSAELFLRNEGEDRNAGDLRSAQLI